MSGGPTFDATELRHRLRTGFPMVNDHPDIAGLLRDPTMLRDLTKALAAPFVDADIDLVVAPEARGPILGALVAYELGVGLVLVRKLERNHPGADIPVETKPTWRGHSEVFQGRSFDFSPGQRVAFVDDWITTGNSLRAMRAVTSVVGATLVGTSVIVNKAEPATIEELIVHSLVDFDDVMS